jgi:hypothetical protein
MKSALGLILGVSMLAVVLAGCGGSDKGTDPIAIGGSSSGGSGAMTGGSATTGGSTTTGGTGTLVEGVPLTPMNGWVDAGSNTLMVSGAMFPFGDPTSKAGPPAMMPVDFSMSGDKACFQGTAAKVDMTSTICTTRMFTPPATDCFGEYWGAAIGLNMNQQIDTATGLGGTPGPFVATALTGFAFEISGDMVPVSSALRFKVEDATGEYCNVAAKPVSKGANKFVFADLVKTCWKPPTPPVTAEAAKAGIIKIAWQVVTNSSSTVPFNFCVTNVRALQ